MSDRFNREDRFALDATSASMQFTEAHEWIPTFHIGYNLGVDGISVALIGLTTLVTILVLLGAWTSIDRRVHQYFASFLILEGLMVGVFCAMDAMLFYVFFEAMLIPMFIIIGVWGGPRRVYAILHCSPMFRVSALPLPQMWWRFGMKTALLLPAQH
jgi:NADH-quinone oxidoreductase subunit M